MKLVVGLGNPGEEYSLSRHNVGFMVIDKFAEVRKMTFSADGNALVSKRNLFSLIKPQTYMNLSGKAVKRFIEDAEALLVVCDDIYLPTGEIRLRSNGGDGGHNGLCSIIQELGTADFYRMRIGVGQPEHSSQLRNYVLEDFSIQEQNIFTQTTDFAIKLIDCFIAKGFQTMLNHYSKNKKSYSERIISESKTEGGN